MPQGAELGVVERFKVCPWNQVTEARSLPFVRTREVGKSSPNAEG